MPQVTENKEPELFPLTQETNATNNEDTNTRYHEKSQKMNEKNIGGKERDICDIAEDLRCGYGKWKPGFLQRCNNPKCLLLCMSIFAMTQGFVVNGVNNVNTSSVERRFELSSSKVGAVSSAYDVSAAIIGLFISYFVSKKNKPRMIAIAAAIMSVGSFVMFLPHFTTGLYEAGQKVITICQADRNVTSSCHKKEDSYLQSYLYVLILGQILHGFGGTTFHIIGVSLLDDSVPASLSPMYIGILYAVFTLGPALGYILGGKLLDIYVDFHEVSTDRQIFPEKMTISFSTSSSSSGSSRLSKSVSKPSEDAAAVGFLSSALSSEPRDYLVICARSFSSHDRLAGATNTIHKIHDVSDKYQTDNT
ncbi:hypothetical protein KUTeg_014594 [Tegillarca granosa]|uniref:Major facilitator superfamily (MFS) profile domain-containing protein n=1 Tax=Tegillarca granosa TaxID=220873 RepID=A0ABQ9EVU5_TEGGR|nr:hypothetical protein KUTeg_014594 [Tegillarca granosa]